MGGAFALSSLAAEASSPDRPAGSAGSAGSAASGRGGVGLIYDPFFLEHLLEPKHPESPARCRAIMDQLKKDGLLRELESLQPASGAAQWALSAHTEAHLRSIERRYPRSHQVALRAVGAGLAAVDAVCTGRLNSVFCVTRPPGHHALNTGREEGFCFYGTAAIAAKYAQRAYGREKALIVDWDYHHGNGTEAVFYEDPTALFFSTHDFHAYPGTGDPARTGAGRGKGCNINVHLDCGAADAHILEAFERFLVPAANRFKPDLIIVSAGFDSRRGDLLGCFDISDAGFAKLTKIVRGLADAHCGGRLVSLLEGGYRLSGLASAAAAHVKALM